MSDGTRGRRARAAPAAVLACTAAFLAIALYQITGVLHDWAHWLAFRYELDYGEGIVWQQALLMFGPRMYSPSPALPFIVFHYPPLYHAVIRALMPLGLDPLLAGRLVSLVASLASAVSIAMLVLMGTRRRRPEQVMVAVALAIMFLCLDPVRRWAVVMRVDALAIALGLVGTVVFVRFRGSTAGIAVALLVCVASLFAKQTQLPAGIAVFVVGLACAPRRAIVAALFAGSIGVAAVAVLQVTTGGFLQNIIGDNINPTNLMRGLAVLWSEREIAGLTLLMLACTIKVIQALWRAHARRELRRFDPVTMTQAVVTLHFALACLASLQIVKDGSSTNYLTDMLASGCIVLGFVLCGAGEAFALSLAMLAVLALTTAKFRHELANPRWLAVQAAEDDRLVDLVAAQTKPVMSDDMVLLMRAGKSVVFEPAIVRVLVAGHRWDPSELLAMIRDHGFAFAMTYDQPGEALPPVTAAIDAAYPRTEPTKVWLTIHYPP